DPRERPQAAHLRHRGGPPVVGAAAPREHRLPRRAQAQVRRQDREIRERRRGRQAADARVPRALRRAREGVALKAALTGSNFVGRRESRAGSAPSRATAPAPGESLDPGSLEATPAEVDQAARAAEAAFEPYAALAPARRAAFLRQIAEELV